MVDVGDKVLSRQGHAAVPMMRSSAGNPDRWIEIQKNTFTNWVNEQLSSKQLCAEDIQYDFCDGVRLVALVESLQQKSLGRIVKEPKNPHQQLGNVSLALKALEDDKIKLINIGAEDIHSANQRLILGLIWLMIIHYQVGRTGRQNRRLMLHWLRAVIPDCHISNFTKDWNDGLALHALLDYCKPGLAPEWRKLDRSQRLQNCRNAMMVAKEEFGIPLVCRPEDMSSPDLDELSGMTYLSYFMKMDSPGYNATMQRTQALVPDRKIRNFQTDWNDGTLLCHMCQNLGASVPGYPNLDPRNSLENLKKGLDAGRSLGVEPVLSAKELADPEVDHIGPMAYCASFKNLAKPTPVMEKCHLVANQETIHVGQGKLCRLDILENDVNKGQIKFMVVTPTQSKGLSPHWHGNYAEIQYQPSEVGVHTLHATLHGEEVKGSPVSFKVAADRNKFAMPGLGPCVLGHVNEIRIESQGTRPSDVCFEARAPSGRIIDLPVSFENGVYVIRFTPTEIGDWQLGMKYEGEHIPGSPMVVRVFDPMRVEVFGLEQANSFVGKSFSFRADCSSAGYGELRVEIQHNRRQVQANVEREVASGIYKIHFTPDGPGKYLIRVYFNGIEVKGSPFSMEISDPSSMKVEGRGLQRAICLQNSFFNIHARGADSKTLKVRITAPTGQEVQSRVHHESDGLFKVEYKPTVAGRYKIEVYVGSIQIGETYYVEVCDPKYSSVVRSEATIVREAARIEIDCAKAGHADLDVKIAGPTGQSIVPHVERVGEKFHVSYVPQEPGKYQIFITYGGVALDGMPIIHVVQGGEDKIHAEGVGLLHAVEKQESTFVVDTHQARGDMLVQVDESRRSGVYDEIDYGRQSSVSETVAKIVRQQSLSSGIGRQSSVTETVNKQHARPQSQVITETVNKLYARPQSQSSDEYHQSRVSETVNTQYVQQRPSSMIETVNTQYVQQRPSSMIETVNTQYVQQRPSTITETVNTPYVLQRPSSITETVNTQYVQQRPSSITETVNTQYVQQRPSSITETVNTQYVQQRPSSITETVNTQYVQQRPSSITETVNTQYVQQRPSSITETVTAYVQPQAQSSVQQRQSSVIERVTKQNVQQSQSSGQYIYGYNEQRSPYQSKVIDVHKVTITGWETMTDGQNRLPLVVGEEKRIHFDTTNAGPGTLSSKVIDPNGVVIPSRIENNFLFFTPQAEGRHDIDVYYDNHRLPRMPIIGHAVNQSLPIDHSKVILIGQGLKEARVREESQFTIDGSQAGPGNPYVHMTGVKADIDVKVTSLGNDQYKCNYTPSLPGAYLLNIHWSDRQVRGSPFKVTVGTMSDAAKVICSGDGLKTGIISQEIKSVIDTRRAGPGELTAHCMGPHKVAYCELFDHRDGTFTLNVKPQEPGRHVLQVKYGGEHVPGSPFVLKVAGAPDASKVRVTGPGVESGILANFRSRFICETRGAGAGQLTVRIRGPKGAFRVEMQRESQKDRTILCRYDPSECGDYIIHVKWSGEHVPGSPFHIHIFDTQEELERFLAENGGVQQAYNSRAWNAEI